jgi:hypothetical protein
MTHTKATIVVYVSKNEKHDIKISAQIRKKSMSKYLLDLHLSERQKYSYPPGPPLTADNKGHNPSCSIVMWMKKECGKMDKKERTYQELGDLKTKLSASGDFDLFLNYARLVWDLDDEFVSKNDFSFFEDWLITPNVFCQIAEDFLDRLEEKEISSASKNIL